MIFPSLLLRKYDNLGTCVVNIVCHGHKCNILYIFHHGVGGLLRLAYVVNIVCHGHKCNILYIFHHGVGGLLRRACVVNIVCHGHKCNILYIFHQVVGSSGFPLTIWVVFYHMSDAI